MISGFYYPEIIYGYTHTHTHTNTHTHSKEYILTSQDRAFINQSERMLGINN